MLERHDIIDVVSNFKDKHDEFGRYASFDYCYNYFHPLNRSIRVKDVEKSCLVLGFYLASWGMFRGSSFLLEKSVKHFERLIVYIDNLPVEVWNIDVDSFHEGNINILVDIYDNIRKILISGGNAHLTLGTKIMLGVFGSVPAYDRFFIQSFGEIFKGRCSFNSFNRKSLECISDFYISNKLVIDDLAKGLYTTCFNSGGNTNFKYTRSKIIDMYGFTKGLTSDVSNRTILVRRNPVG